MWNCGSLGLDSRIYNHNDKARICKYFRYSTLTSRQCELKKIIELSNFYLKPSWGRNIRWFKTNLKSKPSAGFSPVRTVADEPGNFKKLLKPFLFTVGVGGNGSNSKWLIFKVS